MIKDNLGGSPKEEDIINSTARPSLLAQAKAMPRSYWIRVVAGFFIMIFLAASAPNIYLQWKYADVFSASPCQLCLDLNNVTAKCFNERLDVSAYPIPLTKRFTLHPLNELELKANWLSIPCDFCQDYAPKETKACLMDLFAPKKELLNKNENLNFTGFKLPVVNTS